ncbi:MAG TPA: FAD-dependent oxidoreductase [Actinocatenispora sp.]
MHVVVVGTGIAGASTAYHLARAGARVTMVDRDAEGRATAAGAGIVCPWSSRVTDPDWYRLSAAGARYYPELVAELSDDGGTDLGYRRVGALCLAHDPDGLAVVRDRVLARRADAPEAGEVSVLDPADARRLFPPLREDTGAVHVAGAARVDGRRMGVALRRAAERHGATYLAGAARLTVAAGRVTGVDVDGAAVGADAVVVAAGAWTPDLVAGTGVAVDVTPQRGQIVHLGLSGVDTSAWPVVLPQTSHYLLAFDDSRVVVGATRETGSGFDHRVTAAGLAEVLSEALSVAPGLAAATHLETRIGFRPMGSSVTPLLGPVPGLPGLVVLTGLGAGGLTMGPYAGRLAASAALGETPDLDLAPYDPLR